LELDWKNTCDGEESVFLRRMFSHIHILLNTKLHVYYFVPVIQLKRLSIFFTPFVAQAPQGHKGSESL